MTLLAAGDKAPEVVAKDASGAELSLSGLRGRWVLVYFYPKDDTPGCTVEACSLNDALDDLAECGADVIGVSTQSDESHVKFRTKYGLRFALAADTHGKIARAYGTGKELGILPLSARVSFLVGPDGNIAHVWPHVKPKEHAAEVLETVKRLSKQPAGDPV
jgi:thioredoxin-dependent peroxiredoxin